MKYFMGLKNESVSQFSDFRLDLPKNIINIMNKYFSIWIIFPGFYFSTSQSNHVNYANSSYCSYYYCYYWPIFVFLNRKGGIKHQRMWWWKPKVHNVVFNLLAREVYRDCHSGYCSFPAANYLCYLDTKYWEIPSRKMEINRIVFSLGSIYCCHCFHHSWIYFAHIACHFIRGWRYLRPIHSNLYCSFCRGIDKTSCITIKNRKKGAKRTWRWVDLWCCCRIGFFSNRESFVW